MITEDYVSFETAKLLKEKGFDGPCYKVWDSHDDSQTLVEASWFVEGETVVNRELVDAAAKQYAYEYSLNNNVEGYLAPTLQMAMKWLREKQIFITIGFCDYPTLHKSEWIPEVCTHDSIFDEPSIAYSTYEEACEEAIKYCLEKLI